MFKEGHPVWLHRFAVCTAVVTLALIALGGMVTSKGVGMAVPDWPTTYGENMFLFPVSQWVGGVLYEHSHRLLASLVGLLTMIMAGWIWSRDSVGIAKWLGLGWIVLGMGLIGVRTQTMFIVLGGMALLIVFFCLFKIWSGTKPLPWWAMLGYSLVLVQGVLGGLRVTLYKDELGIVHGTVAQLFFLLICSIALVTSRFWRRIPDLKRAPTVANLRYLFLGATLLILAQLILGATMRHQHAGLAVPDFPLAYGKVWPATDAAFVEQVNRTRVDPREFNAITGNHIVLHMVHRLFGLAILVITAGCALAARKRIGMASPLVRWADLWFGLICLQGILGAATVWSNKAAEIATLHQVNGALCLMCGGLLTIVVFRLSQSDSLPITRRADDRHLGQDSSLMASLSL